MPGGLIGYTDRLSARAGGRIALKVSSPNDTTISLALHRVTGARWTAEGMQPDLVSIAHPASDRRHPCAAHPIPAGSHAKAIAPTLPKDGDLSFGLCLWHSGRGRARPATLFALGDTASHLALGLDDRDRPVLVQDGATRLVLERAVPRDTWSVLSCTLNGGTACLHLSALEGGVATTEGALTWPRDPAQVSFAALLGPNGARNHFDGRLAYPTIALAGGLDLHRALQAGPAAIARLGPRRVGAWDFARAITTQRIVDTGASRCDGVLTGRPARAVTGPPWDGSAFDWRQRPDHYGAIHFHRDDLDDCGWPDAVVLDLSADLTPGLYAIDIWNADGRDLVPFVLRAAEGTAPRLAVLLPTFTYLSYGNARDAMRGPDFGLGRTGAEATLAATPALGKSQYDLHEDRSPVMVSSPRRPLMSMRLGVRPWGLPVDAALLGWLGHLGRDYDLLTDHDLHAEGYRALAAYDCVLTGNHPEYHSAETLDAIEAFTHRGGRLMYLGGNGFYWRVSVCPETGTIEVRRAEDGTRAWIAAPGEAHHAMDGGYGGLWRRLGRAPNRLVGIGFAAQGDFTQAGHYRLRPGIRDSAAGFALEGVTGEFIGDFGWLGGGAAGQEIDRADAALGTPQDTVILASSEGHGPAMMRTIEEMLSSVPPFDDPKARADMIFRQVPGGGAVFSVGSMTWIGSLDHAGFDNDVARISGNVLARFLDPAPFSENRHD